MRTPEAEGLSEKARTLLTEMLNSGNAQQVYVASALDEIASNGEGQETDAFLAVCAHEIACEAALVAKQLKPRGDDQQSSEYAKPADPDVVVDMLGLVDVTVDEATVEKWSEPEREQAANWAGLVHLHANDNDDVVVPTCPYFVPPGDTDKRLAARIQKGEDGYNWKVFVDEKLVGNIHLPSYFDVYTAKRFAYQKFKAAIRAGSAWEVQ